MRRLLAVLGLACTTACLSNDKSITEVSLSPTDTVVAGTYVLSTINGGDLPVVVAAGPGTATDLTADTFTISGDSTWADSTTFTVVTGGQSSTTVTATAGVYHIVNRTIQFTTTVGGTATFQGSVTATAAVGVRELDLLFNKSFFAYESAQ